MKLLRRKAHFTGYVVYHGEYFSEWHCPNKKCGFHVSEEYICCPYCGQRLRFPDPPDAGMIRISVESEN